jgi:hypothetical protein
VKRLTTEAALLVAGRLIRVSLVAMILVLAPAAYASPPINPGSLASTTTLIGALQLSLVWSLRPVAPVAEVTPADTSCPDSRASARLTSRPERTSADSRFTRPLLGGVCRRRNRNGALGYL